MGIAELIILGAALSMDAFAVTISNTFSYRNLTRAQWAAMPIAFGAFQGIMPLTGFLLGSLVSSVISAYAGIVTFLILGLIGAKMIWDALHEEADGEESTQGFTPAVLLLQALATSIDALAVGVSFAALAVDAPFASGIIALTTCLCCTVALFIGRRFGNLLGERAAVIGGIVLIAIGVKALLF